jgi:hypothetical protein
MSRWSRPRARGLAALVVAVIGGLGAGCGSGFNPKKAYPAGPSCGGYGEPCQSPGANLCCTDLACNGLFCCVRTGNPCSSDHQCCSNRCVDGVCACGGFDESCAGDSDCCAGNDLECGAVPGWTGRCEVRPGGRCTMDDECVSLACGAGAACACSGPSGICYRDSDCCVGTCAFPNGDPFQGLCACASSGSACNQGSQCCSGTCDAFSSQCD